MDSPGASASAPQTEPARPHNYLLLIGGYFSLTFAAFQVSAIWWSPEVIEYFGGPADLKTFRPMGYAALCLAVAAIVGIFGLYALSGAGTIRRLPLLRAGLIVIAAIYLLRGLLAIWQMPMVLKHPHLVRFLVFSLISLCVGAVYARGIVGLYKYGRPGESRL